MHGLLLAALVAVGSPVEVTWTGDGRCPQTAYQASLDGYLAAVTQAEPLRARVETKRGARGRWTLVLTLDGADGSSTRRLHGASCASVSAAAAFVTAVLVDPTLVGRVGSTDAPPPVEATPVEAPPVEATQIPVAPPETGPGLPIAAPPEVLPDAIPAGEPPSAPQPSPPSLPSGPQPTLPEVEVEVEHPSPADRSPRVRGSVRVAGGFEALGAPRIGGQVQGAAGLLGRAWRVELRGSYRAPTRVDAPGQLGGVGARIGLWTVGVHGCGVLRPGPVEVPLCAGVEAGQAFGSGSGYEGARTAKIPFLALVASTAVAWAPRRWVALWLGIELAAPLVRGTFGIGGVGEVHAVGVVSPRGLFGVELRFPAR